MSELKDSGQRREFESGAVRDIQDGKGRCDLLVLDIAAVVWCDDVLASIGSFMLSGNEVNLENALTTFCNIRHWDEYTALLEVAIHYEDGAKKYSENNWKLGIPLHCFIDSGVRHYLKYMRGDDDEPHDRAFVWNMLGALWTIKHKPELIDIAFQNAEGIYGKK